MSLNINTADSTEKRISLVYNSDITGYQALDFSKLNNIEDILFTWSGQGLDVNQDDLSASADFVTAVPPKGTSISNYTASGTNGIILAANSNRQELYVQNLATGALFVKYGSSAASNSFNFVLAGNTYVNGGDGGSVSDQGYTGIVSVSGANNLTPNYISWERS